MKNQILLSALLFCGFAATANETTTSIESSPAAISSITLQVVKIYCDLGIACAHYINGVTNDRAALLKACSIASELLKNGLALAKKEAQTDDAHEMIYEFEQQKFSGFKMGIAAFKATVASPEISDEELRGVLLDFLHQLPEPIQSLILG